MDALLEKMNRKRIWDEEPVFCFTSDIDWASEDALQIFFRDFNDYGVKLTTFVTHYSRIIEEQFAQGRIERGIHPNFLPNSSHGNDFRTVIETCLQWAPEAMLFRSHRLFDVTDITHMLYNDFNFRCVSNLGTVLQTGIRPLLHESGLVHVPIFFEDGTHLYNKLRLDLNAYNNYFTSPGIKIISIHPMNYVINTPYIQYMREIKDTLSREEYNNMRSGTIEAKKNGKTGITDLCREIIELSKKHTVYTLREIYEHAIQ